MKCPWIRATVKGSESLPARGAWIEISVDTPAALAVGSLPARGAWIEIDYVAVFDFDDEVAPRTGSVD